MHILHHGGWDQKGSMGSGLSSQVLNLQCISQRWDTRYVQGGLRNVVWGKIYVTWGEKGHADGHPSRTKLSWVTVAIFGTTLCIKIWKAVLIVHKGIAKVITRNRERK